MLQKCCLDSGKDWDEGVPSALFAKQESLQFSPAEFDHSVCGPVKVLKESCEADLPNVSMNVFDYVSSLHERWH